MMSLETLFNLSRKRKRRKLLGRGPASGNGKTCGRGHKGAGSRSGYKRREGKEGGGVPLYRRVPARGFSNARFSKKLDVINLGQIERLFQEGEAVSMEALQEKRFLKRCSYGVKVLGKGTLTKKIILHVDAISDGAREKLEKIGVKC